MTHDIPLPSAQKSFNRDAFIELDAGLKVRSFRFVRDAALAWLSNFPGDLKVSWFYARSLSGEGRRKLAIPIYKGLSIADPEFIEAAEELVENLQTGDNEKFSVSSSEINAHLFALTGEQKYAETASAWGRELWLARVALSKGRLNLAEESIRRVLLAEPSMPLAAVTHLQFLAANPAIQLENKLAQVKRYKAQWPDCLAGNIYLAEWLMASGDVTQSVALIHQVGRRSAGRRRRWFVAAAWITMEQARPTCRSWKPSATCCWAPAGSARSS